MSPLEPLPLAPIHSDADARFMAAALALGRRGLGLAAPNPSVAALVVRDGVIVGRGVTAPGGRPHGERLALEQAGEAAIGATLYVTLEPCARRSQRIDSAACTDLIIAAGIARVVTGADDPSPHASSEGFRRLEAAGIRVTRGVLGEACRRSHLGHVLRVTEGRPLLTLKLAMTADGWAATADRRPLAITGEAANAFTHGLRARHEAVMVGIGTVLSDDPRLTVRLPGLGARSPIRVVLDSRLRLPATARLLREPGPPVWVVAAVAAPVAEERRLRAAGAEVMRVDPARGGRGLDLAAALRLLAARGITRLMVEGGPTLGESLAAADLVDELVLLRSPRALGGEGLPALGPRLRRWREVIPPASHHVLPGGDSLVRHERRR